jgi:hypothetical protein
LMSRLIAVLPPASAFAPGAAPIRAAAPAGSSR